MAARTSRIIRASVVGGLLAGALDIIYACAFSWWSRGVTPDRVLRYVASGLLGPEARTGGAEVAALGLLLHFLIAIIAAWVFVVASLRWTMLRRQAVGAGLAFGLLVYGAMNYVIVPLSLAPASYPQANLATWTGLVVHALFGLIVALTARRVLKGR